MTTTTFLFTDIEGSTAAWEADADIGERIDRHFVTLRDAVEAAGGRVFATMGDGVAAAFGSAAAAVQAAIRAQLVLRELDLSVRMGVHTGEVADVDGDFRGRPVNRAARVMAAANGGQILLSDVTAALARSASSSIVLADLGSHVLRDLAEPERLWQVLHPELPRAFPAVRGSDAFQHNLPAQRTSLVGRDDEVALVGAATGQHRIVTLTGVGGVGKTRVAVHAAADLLPRYAAVWFVELAGVAAPDDVPDALAVALGAAAVGDALAASIALLAGQPTLLVLDSCEHVVAGAAAVVDAAVAACPSLTVLATSREPLGVEGEHVLPVRPLEPASTGVELFRQRAASAGAELRDGDADVVGLCAGLDGIPLAIELAAARAASLGLAAVAGGLGHLDLRSSRRRGHRHETMRATIEWSHRLLDGDEQRLLEWLAVLPGGFELDAAVHIGAGLGLGDGAVTEHVASLVTKSMLATDADTVSARYRLLEAVRAFALERLDARGERPAALDALASWVASVTDLPYADCCSAEVERSALRLEREADNWREAVAWAARRGSGALAARLCGPPTAYFLLGRQDLADVVRPLLAHAGAPLERRGILCALLVSSSGSADGEQLERWAGEVEAAEAIETTGLGHLMRWLVLAWRGEFEASVELCAAGSLDPRYPQATRDLLLGIAVLDRFSLTACDDELEALVDRALETGARSEVALTRVSCLLGSAWALAPTEPRRSLELVRRAVEDMPRLPALTRLTMPGSASRLLSTLDPAFAAQGLLDQLESRPARRSFVDLVPLLYAAAFLDRIGEPAAIDAVGALTRSPIASYLSMMDTVDLARQAATSSSTVSLRELDDAVRSALRDVVARASRQPVAIS